MGVAILALAALSAGGADNIAPRAVEAAQTTKAAAGHSASSFTITDYYRWRDSIARNDAATDAAALDSRFRGNDGNRGLSPFGTVADNLRTWTNTQLRTDGDIWRGAVVDIANGGDGNDALGDNFNAFYEKAQMQMFSAIDNAFAVYATDSLVGGKSVKSAKVRFQSALGNRKAQLGIDVIGAIHEKHYDDSTNKYAIGWQAHIYAAEGENKGASGGIFYRRIQNNILYGVNAFADYERHQYGDFYRYGIGGEVQNQHIAFGANYYAPLTDDIPINAAASVVAFSRKGYDANLRIAIPGARYLQAEAAYYYYDGREDGSFGENKVEADEGFRYGAALSPGNGIVLKVFYDDGGEEFGGELSWLHKFNNPAQADPQRYDTPFVADLFAPVLREHSQRIALATIRSALPPPLRFEALAERHIRGGRYTPVMAVHIPPDYFDGPPSFEVRNFRLYNNSLHITLPNATVFFEPTATTFDTDVEVFVRGMVNGVLTATSFHRNYRTASPAGFYNFNPAMAHITSTLESTVGVFSPYANFDGGGIGPFFCYSSHADVRIVRRDNSREEGGDCLVLFDTENRQKTITVTLTSEDGTADFPPATRRLILTAIAGAISPRSVPFVVGTQTPVANIILPGGRVAGNLPSGFAVQNNTIILFNATAPGRTTHTLTITAGDSTFTASFALTAFAPLGAAFAETPTLMFVTANITATVGTIRPSGGIPPYNYQSSRDDIVIGEDGLVLFDRERSKTITAVLTTDDSIPQSPPVPITITLEVVTAIALPLAGRTDFHGSVFLTGFFGTVGTVAASGGNGDYSYAFVGGDDFTFDANSRQLRFSVNAAGAKTATIEVSDSDAATPPVSVFITASAFAGECDMLNGCAVLGYTDRRIMPTLTLVQAMVAAGADISRGTLGTATEGVISGLLFQHLATPSRRARLRQAVLFLVAGGADVNVPRNGNPFNGRTAVDSANIAGGLGTEAFDWLPADARCNAFCRTGQTDLSGQVCTRDTNSVSADCRP